MILIDAKTGEIKHMRFIGLSEKFTKSLLGAAMEEKMKPWDFNQYQQSIDKMYRYLSKEISKMCSASNSQNIDFQRYSPALLQQQMVKIEQVYFHRTMLAMKYLISSP